MPFKTENLSLLDSPSEKEFTLTEPVVYELDGRYCMVPKGFKTDLFSVPWYLRWAYAQVQTDNRPAVLHDFLLRSCLFRWVGAADIMDRAMTDCGYSKSKRFMIIGAIKTWGFFRKYPTAEELMEAREIQRQILTSMRKYEFLKGAEWLV